LHWVTERIIGVESRVARFRAKAAACGMAAQLAGDPSIKQTYLDMAKQWRELSEQVEMLDEKSAG